MVSGVRKRIAENGWRNTFVSAGRRLQKSVVGTDEVLLFQWRPETQDSEQRPGPAPLTWEIMSAAAMRYSDERETLDYLLRCASRFRSGKSNGFALLGADGVALHLAWVAPYEGFSMAEVGEVLSAPGPASMMIFDCWTPLTLRGQGLYARMIGQLACRLAAEGKDAWIFSAATNSASVAGIVKAGFELRTSLLKRKLLWWARTTQESRGLAESNQVDAVSNGALR